MDNVITVDLASEHQVIRKSTYYQYDYGLKLRLENAPDVPLLIELANVGDTKIQHDEPYTGADIERFVTKRRFVDFRIRARSRLF